MLLCFVNISDSKFVILLSCDVKSDVFDVILVVLDELKACNVLISEVWVVVNVSKDTEYLDIEDPVILKESVSSAINELIS